MTTKVLADYANRLMTAKESLDDGSVVWVACDIKLDGCIAQGETEAEAIASLEEAREEYLAVQNELRTDRSPRARPTPTTPLFTIGAPQTFTAPAAS